MLDSDVQIEAVTSNLKELTVFVCFVCVLWDWGGQWRIWGNTDRSISYDEFTE